MAFSGANQALRWPYHVLINGPIRVLDAPIRLSECKLSGSQIALSGSQNSDGPIRVSQDTGGSIRVLDGHIRLSVQVEPIKLSDMAL